MSSKDAEGMANRVEPDQNAPSGSALGVHFTQTDLALVQDSSISMKKKRTISNAY